ncbi:MAG: DUF3524 domain-containing protein [Desulfobacteraceae bacterium]
MKFLFLESFFGGSHKDFALGLKKHSIHGIDLVTLPARFWKWRMQAAALYFHETCRNLQAYDGIIASDMMNLSDFLALTGPAAPPVLIYFHENQFTYPLCDQKKSNQKKANTQLGMINITTALCADMLIFNSRFHQKGFIKAVDHFIGTRPDSRPAWVSRAITEKSEVIYPGCRFDEENRFNPALKISPPLIVWNHRWEYDKQPEVFFRALKEIKKKNIPFSLAVLGEHGPDISALFKKAEAFFEQEIVRFGYVESRQAYLNWLKKGSAAVSTAIQENFGISMVEAVRMGCFPLVPDRLSYPEIMPENYKKAVIYRDFEDLVSKLGAFLTDHVSYTPLQDEMAAFMGKYAWEHLIPKYDAALTRLGEIKRFPQAPGV